MQGHLQRKLGALHIDNGGTSAVPAVNEHHLGRQVEEGARSPANK